VLTGESVPVDKQVDPVAPDAELAARTSMLHSGTLVATGQAVALAVATGPRSRIGRIGALLGGIEPLETPLLRQIRRFGGSFTVAALVAALALFLFALAVRGYAWLDALMVVVALAVGVVPESLPAVITITLAIGVRRMAARHAIVRRLPAVETLGATSTICSDKTGTLTRNEMTARRFVTSAGTTEVEGAGYEPCGALRFPDDAPQPDAAGQTLRPCALLCTEAHRAEREGQWQVDGDPMEGALVTLSAKAGLASDEVRQAWTRLDEIPFDAAHRFMASLHRAPDD